MSNVNRFARRALVAIAILAALALASQVRPFTDPMTHHDGGYQIVVGPVWCAWWSWNDPDVVVTGPPVNCGVGG